MDFSERLQSWRDALKWRHLLWLLLLLPWQICAALLEDRFIGGLNRYIDKHSNNILDFLAHVARFFLTQPVAGTLTFAILIILGLVVHAYWQSVPPRAGDAVSTDTSHNSTRVKVRPGKSRRQSSPTGAAIAEIHSIRTYSAEERRPSNLWPNVSLDCKWVPIQSTLPSEMREVRNRTFLLRNEEPDAVYKVKIQDIPLSPFVARFPQLNFMAGREKRDVYPTIYRAGEDSVPLPAHDLESCLAADSVCETRDYEDPKDPMVVTIPLAVRYFDKLGDCYEVVYRFAYDRYDQSAEVTRSGGIEKII